MQHSALTQDISGADEAVAIWCSTESKNDVAAINWLLIALKRGVVTLPGLISGVLGPHLTSESTASRARSIELLGTLIDRLPKLQLPANVLNLFLLIFIFRFYLAHFSRFPHRCSFSFVSV